MQASRGESKDGYEDDESNMEMEVCQYTHINEIQKGGINAADIQKLIEAGLTTTGMVLKQPMKVLLNIKGFSEAKVEKIKQVARKYDIGNNNTLFLTGTQVKEKRMDVIKISTGSQNFNALLGGGVETGSITEVYGEFRTGKTQLAHTLCVTAQMERKQGGGCGKAIFVDTEGNFRPERIESIATRFGVDPTETLDNIVVARAYSHDQQIEMLKPMAAMISENGPFRLIVIDSIIALFRVEFVGRGELSERQQKIAGYLGTLIRMAEEFNIAIFAVNQCQADPGAMSMFGPVLKPVGGNIMAHASCTRLHLKKGREDNRVAKLVDSPTQAEGEAQYRLSDGGVDDPL